MINEKVIFKILRIVLASKKIRINIFFIEPIASIAKK